MLPYRWLTHCSKPFKFFTRSASSSSHCFHIEVWVKHHGSALRGHTTSKPTAKRCRMNLMCNERRNSIATMICSSQPFRTAGSDGYRLWINCILLHPAWLGIKLGVAGSYPCLQVLATGWRSCSASGSVEQVELELWETPHPPPASQTRRHPETQTTAQSSGFKNSKTVTKSSRHHCILILLLQLLNSKQHQWRGNYWQFLETWSYMTLSTIITTIWIKHDLDTI